ncbi:hypothetical protein [Myroides marinus]|uniref:Transmembrane protein n=1 Tax=Myroides marinus TaxID=703342 RepID=A0A1H6RBW2_9FLAO|nr:hypothetical protein [Myroides marinus]MDM1378222.1 hypothetical protein [Myroides marinus]MDM1385392.1 hypothetical protein [Myroides marinus]MDM1392605.1 hypothetical protein [Myroides marinus]SEI50017.1 hypothetical protein SAMN04488018_101197 [Myroides marinus]
MNQQVKFNGTGWFFRVSAKEAIWGSIIFLGLFCAVFYLIHFIVESVGNETLNSLQMPIFLVLLFVVSFLIVQQFIVPHIKFNQLVFCEGYISIYKTSGEHRVYLDDINTLQVNVILEDGTIYKERYSGFRFLTTKGTYVISMIKGVEDKCASEPMSNMFYKLLSDRLDLDNTKCKKSRVYKRSYGLVYELKAKQS